MGWLMKSYKTKNMNLQLFAGEITDLTGTIWELNSTISHFSPDNINLLLDNGYEEIYDINFYSNSINFESVKFRDADWYYQGYGLLFFRDSNPVGVYNYSSNVFSNQAYRTITITGGTDTTNQDLISWLQSNATQIQNSITDLTGTSWQFNSLSSDNFGKDPMFDDDLSYCEVNSINGYFINGFYNNTSFTGIGYFSIDWTDIIAVQTTNICVQLSINDIITITGGTDATNFNLIYWLQENATQVQTGYNSTITLTNCTCNKSSESGLSGNYSATITANDGYYLSSVTSTLGIVEIATNLKTATVTINDVTENFTIEAIGTEIGKLDIILHPNNNGVTDYTKEILPKVKTASTLDINRLFRTEYTITKTIINGSASGDTNIWSEETAQVTITPDENYNLPSTITVINANNTYNNESGVVSLSNATGNVTISATCESAAWSGTDLTGTSWVFNNLIEPVIDGGQIRFYINFSSNGNNYQQIYSEDADDYELRFGYDWVIVYNFRDNLWNNSLYKTITITGGTDVTNSNLISWLQANATLLSW